jgi:hypothetical protein
LPVVVAWFGEHVLQCDELVVVIGHALLAPDMTNRAKAPAAELANTLGNYVGHGKDPARLFV